MFARRSCKKLKVFVEKKNSPRRIAKIEILSATVSVESLEIDDDQGGPDTGSCAPSINVANSIDQRPTRKLRKTVWKRS